MSLVTLPTDLFHVMTKDPDEDWSKEVYSWPLLQSPTPTIIVCLSYVFFVKIVGPKWMSGRKSFDIGGIIIWYNIIMASVNLHLFFRFGNLGWFSKYNWSCAPLDRTRKSMDMNWTSYLYFLTKFVDLLDTVFFVLRKKFDQVTYLHLVHHSSMPLYTYLGMRLAPNGHGTLSCMVNCFVHVIMYSYYLLSILGVKVWWKKYLTQLQLVQFFLLFGHFTRSYMGDCDYPVQSFYIMVILLTTFTALFVNFYVQSYLGSTSQGRHGGRDMNDNLLKRIKD